MPVGPISKEEKDFVCDSARYSVRCDGRALLEYRPIHIKSNIHETCAGSSTLMLGNTHVVTAIKAEIAPVDLKDPESGRILINVNCHPGCRQDLSARELDEYNRILTQTVNLLLKPADETLRKLCFYPDNQCWNLYVDTSVLSLDGNVYDAVALSIFSALRSTRIPKVLLSDEDADRPVEIDVIADLDEAEDKELELPLILTLVKLGEAYLADPSGREEACGGTTIHVSYNTKGDICGMHCVGDGARGYLFPESLGATLEISKRLSQLMLARLVRCLDSEFPTKLRNTHSQIQFCGLSI